MPGIMSGARDSEMNSRDVPILIELTVFGGGGSGRQINVIFISYFNRLIENEACQTPS